MAIFRCNVMYVELNIFCTATPTIPCSTLSQNRLKWENKNEHFLFDMSRYISSLFQSVFFHSLAKEHDHVFPEMHWNRGLIVVSVFTVEWVRWLCRSWRESVCYPRPTSSWPQPQLHGAPEGSRVLGTGSGPQGGWGSSS